MTKKEAADSEETTKNEGWHISQESGLRGVGPAAQVVGCPHKLAVNEPSGRQTRSSQIKRTCRVYFMLFASRSAAMTAGPAIEDGPLEENVGRRPRDARTKFEMNQKVDGKSDGAGGVQHGGTSLNS
jgi:hypothetical protein